ncbi:MAG: PRC-barrel domain-containing protein [Hyphomicrobiales bacterium]|nr:PRC-barrel domain-containing protein [Rhodoblastus sp.]MCC2104088.1 PRC-barrel domain-containing protein [Hyphomicrobiales bacterium]MCC2106909.1 PRC-barrel domain-containing protein [Hyphomicrobiales bacterium]MCO5085301.1 PRC-barrel domain-containing protein [Methylobacteriaceae bacterium]HRY05228.1 PRC-barrel domain-containing protein [Beijerinckiaceae bacterium]
MRSNLLVGGMLAFALSNSAFAASTMSAPPSNSVSVTMYYKQTVYDPKQNKIGEVDDVLVDKTGKIEAFVVGVGGFLGIGEKDVIVPFDAVKVMHKDTTGTVKHDATASKNPPPAGTTANPPATKANPPATTAANEGNRPVATGTAAHRDNSDAWLAIDETKDTLKAAPGFSYDRTSMMWKPTK